MTSTIQENNGLVIDSLSTLGDGRAQEILGLIRGIPDYPEPGVLFRDITGMLADGPAMRDVVRAFARSSQRLGHIDIVAGMEARGFLLGAPLALELGVGFVPIRKAGKLPPPTLEVSYALEYGSASLEIREGTIPAGARVLIVDDVLATGGTAAAGAELVERCGGEVRGLSFLLELDGLPGRERLAGRTVDTLMRVTS